MGLFGKKSEGGMMDVIRCDEQEYLVWKWRPSGEANSTKKKMQYAMVAACVLKMEKWPFLFTSKKTVQCKILLLALMTKQ